MDNRVYYGEYSLRHWINLMLNKNIVLPEYQRHFVWNKESVIDFIEALKSKQFIPPVTIGALNIEGILQNLILDGQQRLTSILLGSLKLFPDRDTYRKPVEQTANENDDEEENELPDIIEWTFETYLKEQSDKKEGHYLQLKLNDINEEFLNNTFLGFSYLVPFNTNKTEQQKYYSTVFRNINIKGVTLLRQESRRSLYFLNNDLADFFEPDFSKLLKINKINLDFVRYLALLSQFHKENRANNVAKYYGRKWEEYYEEYIYSVAGVNNKRMFYDFSNLFPEDKYISRYDRLKHSINALDIGQFSSIIDADMYLFGMIYEIVFENKSIDETKKDNLKIELDAKITEFKIDYSHRKTPSALKYTRARLDESIKIYRKYVV